MIDLDFTFEGDVWIYAASKASWHMVTVPVDITADIKAFTKHTAKGFRAVKVGAKIGDTEWQTALFPDSKSGCYFLPLKASVRAAEGISKGSTVAVSLRVVV